LKPDKFKQPTPVMQLTALRSSLEGHWSNWEDDNITSEKLAAVVAIHLEDLQALEPHLEAGKWIEEKKS